MGACTKRQRKEQITRTLLGSIKPMRVQEICDALDNQIGAPYVSSLLLRMEGEGSVKRLGNDKKGHYLWAAV